MIAQVGHADVIASLAQSQAPIHPPGAISAEGVDPAALSLQRTGRSQEVRK